MNYDQTMKLSPMRNYILLATLGLSLAASAQTINFETTDYKSLGVYDTWEASPFRTGKLKGNYAVVDNHLAAVEDMLGYAPNPSKKILAVQRSRFGSNTFGVRIDLNKPFELTPQTKYIHVMVNRPYDGRVMVVGLGKRTDRPAQSPETEQFWAMSTVDVAADRWVDVVLPFKGNGGIEIHSLVVVPDCESPHDYKSDAICYIDNIVVNDNPSPIIVNNPAAVSDNSLPAMSNTCRVNDANRNGEVLAADGSALSGYIATSRKPFTIRMRPEKGFEYSGIIVKYGYNLAGDSVDAQGNVQWRSKHFERQQFGKDHTFTIPAECMVGNVEIEGLFIEEGTYVKPKQ